MRFLNDQDSDDPLLSVVNLVDVFLVVVAMLMIVVVKNPLNPFSDRDVTVIENPGQPNMKVTIKEGQELKRYESSSEVGEGKGTRAGTTYRLPDGRMIYVPE
ncbi:DUF2149 domain-containing protein [Tardiphaga robiniae]|uniref:DUF2149 domain-containing protein n=1 Tax=Tardiphaga robiniae TaxID=943830 RepID=A0A163X5V8_9BRAD|nr:DUF2149 domain-containing protein [Tardiphaga robiniae]KZD20456.1 hypothetical protein A4A58_19740 [Tardiphaga robiniae]QND69820.1 DUF2149 domain-containing protein [Tardiphaga robiniae]